MTSSNSAGGDAVGLPGALEALRQTVCELDGRLWATRPSGELVGAVAALEALQATLAGFELGLLAHLDATRGVQPQGWATAGDFVTSVAGVHRREGSALVRLARALQEPRYDPVAHALGDGWLSRGKAAVIVRAVEDLPGTADHSRAVELMLAQAKALDLDELTKTARHLVRVVDPDGEDRRQERALAREERAAHHDRFLSILDDRAGGARITGRCAAEDAALLRTSLMALAAPHPAGRPTCDPASCREPGCRHDGRDPRESGARLLDALVETCRRVQTAQLLPDQHGATPRIAIHIALADLRTGLGTGTTDEGLTLSAAAVRRLACDADLIPAVMGSPSEVLDLGRTHRLITPPLWRALVIRDRHCCFPGCTRPPLMCQAHHVHHWADGGPTNLNNLVLLCGHHHRLLHHTPWHIHHRTHGTPRFIPPHTSTHTPQPPPDPPPRE